MHTTKLLAWMLFLASWLTACQTAASATSTPPPPPSATSAPLAIPSATTLPPPSATPQPTTPILAPSPTTAVGSPATPAPQPSCVTISYEGNAQFELFAPQGERVLVDVYDPAQLSAPVTADDILLTTHAHWDHINDAFLSRFPGQQMFIQASEMALPWVNIHGIASAHNDGDAFKPEGGTNYIYLLEVGGLRLAHFGDIGQEAFTEEQLAALQPLDIAIIQIANSYSDMSAANQKGLKLIAQLNPRLVIPTHADLDSAKLAAAQWPGLYSEKVSVRLCRDQLPAATQILFLGEWAVKFPKFLDLLAVDW